MCLSGALSEWGIISLDRHIAGFGDLYLGFTYTDILLICQAQTLL